MSTHSPKLAISQRVDEHPSYAERRDSLDQRWYGFAEMLGCTPIPLPNVAAEGAAAYMAALQPAAIILSGGNTLLAQDADAADAAPERDAFESAVLDWALDNDVPVLGVCRGMQMINHYFGGTTARVDGHVAERHAVTFCGDLDGSEPMQVNSYHNYGITPEQLGEPLAALAVADDGTVEALKHESHKVAAIMWHPERESATAAFDIAIARRFLEL